jgi:hypothetical protein
VSSNCLRRMHTLSCGCYRLEFLKLGPMRASTPAERPSLGVFYPVPEILYPVKSKLFNEVKHRQYQNRWARVEMEIRRGGRTKTEVARPPASPMKPFKPKESVTVRALPPMDEAELYGATSLRDRVRVVTG